MTDASSTNDDIDKTLDIVDGIINSSDNPKDSNRSKASNDVPSASASNDVKKSLIDREEPRTGLPVINEASSEQSQSQKDEELKGMEEPPGQKLLGY